MIPKIIHYCWLSNDPFPDNIQRCIDSWKDVLPDYELRLWDFQRFPKGKSKWVDQAFDTHKYAFAADYIRLYALYNYGGIYLDCDVEVIKSFDDLLSLPYFIGQENTPSGIEAATIGCEKGNKLIKDLLESYKEKSFIKSDGTFEDLPLPFIFRKCIEAGFFYNYISDKKDFSNNPDVINVFPIDFFSPKHWKTKELNITDRTYSIHHFAASWVDNNISQKEADNDTHEKKSTPIKPTLVIRLRRGIGNFSRRYAIKNKYCAKVYFTLYKRAVFQPTPSLIIYKSDYPLIVHLDKPLCNCEIEFIKKEESRHKDKIKDFFPIMRIKGSLIEIHPYNHNSYLILTKEKCRELFDSIKP